MVDQNDLDPSSEHDDLYDEAAPRSIFAATWFRAVLVLIVLGVVGAVAVPYILDAMNAPPPKTAAVKPLPSAPSTAPPVAPAPPAAAPPPVTAPPPAIASSSSPTAASSATPALPAAKPAPPAASSVDKKDAMLAGAPTAADGAKTEMSTPDTTAPGAKADGVKSESAKPETVKPDAAPPKGDATPAKPAAPVRGSKLASTASKRPSGGQKTGQASGQWYVQVGAFKDPAIARSVAAKLRADNYQVVDPTAGAPVAMVATATTTPPGSDRYDVIITGEPPADLGQRLAAKNVTVESTPTGAVLKPSLPLRDAVALSKDLAVDGLKVQVRRAGGAATPSSPPPGVAAPARGDGFYRVSVGGFSDRPAALATLKELEGKGYKPFLTRR